jgi:hypothetical protein
VTLLGAVRAVPGIKEETEKNKMGKNMGKAI